MDIILQCKRKANNRAEKFTNKPDNISMEQAKRYAPEDEQRIPRIPIRRKQKGRLKK